jgi:hypothetical protein
MVKLGRGSRSGFYRFEEEPQPVVDRKRQTNPIFSAAFFSD